jgi:hypothetical protein
MAPVAKASSVDALEAALERLRQPEVEALPEWRLRMLREALSMCLRQFQRLERAHATEALRVVAGGKRSARR